MNCLPGWNASVGRNCYTTPPATSDMERHYPWVQSSLLVGPGNTVDILLCTREFYQFEGWLFHDFPGCWSGHCFPHLKLSEVTDCFLSWLSPMMRHSLFMGLDYEQSSSPERNMFLREKHLVAVCGRPKLEQSLKSQLFFCYSLRSHPNDLSGWLFNVTISYM